MSRTGRLVVTLTEGRSVDLILPGGDPARVVVRRARGGKGMLVIEAPLEIEIRRTPDSRSADEIVGRRIETGA